MSITIGADPEFWVKHKETGKVVSAHPWERTLGTKKTPLPCTNGGTQVDGLALEFNINPASSRGDFLENINTVLGHIRGIVSPDFEFVFDPVVDFSEDEFEKSPISNRQLGCDPDLNAWTGRPNNRPVTPLARSRMRTASGHVHVGVPDPSTFDAPGLVKELDAVLYPLSTLWDDDTDRRVMYGAPGAYRPKPYGLEYRVLSNRWLQTPELITFVYDTTRKVTENFLSGQSIVAETLFTPEILGRDISTSEWIDEYLVGKYNYGRP